MIETKTNIIREAAALKQMTVKELRDRYVVVFGEAARSGNKDWLWKRIAWRMQANADGDLTERARRRAEELATDSELPIRLRKFATDPLTRDPESNTSRGCLFLARFYKILRYVPLSVGDARERRKPKRERLEGP